jgi:hypothetical protein
MKDMVAINQIFRQDTNHQTTYKQSIRFIKNEINLLFINSDYLFNAFLMNRDVQNPSLDSRHFGMSPPHPRPSVSYHDETVKNHSA